MRARWIKYAVVLIVVFFAGSFAAQVAFSSLPTQNYHDAVNAAIAWIGSTGNGSKFIDVTDPNFGVVNASFPGHLVYYRPFDSASPSTAGYDATFRSAQYIIITDLTGAGIPSNENLAWNTFSSQTLSGAELSYQNTYVRIFYVIKR